MVDTLEHAPGTPSWVDLGSPDLETSKAFYGSLFGWEAHVSPEPEAGGYTLFTSDGKQVAGAGPLFSPDQHPAWTSYVSTTDAEATARAVQEAGGQVVMGPMDVLDAGRMAVFLDPTGAAISVWQPGSHRGAQKVDEPGSLCWTELYTRDLPRSKEFYSRVFGWGSETNPMPQGGSYTEWKVDGKSIGGAIEMDGQFPPDIPQHWMPYFAVEDCDASLARAQELGGTVMVPPTDIDPGRFAILHDPHGAVFAIIALKS